MPLRPIAGHHSSPIFGKQEAPQAAPGANSAQGAAHRLASQSREPKSSWGAAQHQAGAAASLGAGAQRAKRAPSPVFGAFPAKKAARAEISPAPPFPLGPRLDPLRRAAPTSYPGPSPLVADLLADTSDMALRPPDPSAFAFFDDHVGSAVASSVPLNTGAKNATSWRLWEEFCHDVWSTPPLRADSGSQFNMERERFLVAAFVVWLQSHEKVRSKIKGRSLPKPDTLMGHAYAVRRVHVLNGRNFHQFRLAKHVLRTFSARYCSLYGSVAPARKEPLSLAPCSSACSQFPAGSTSADGAPSTGKIGSA